MEEAIYFYYAKQAFQEFSNFYPAATIIDGRWWVDNEHYFQAMKTLDPNAQEAIRLCPTPRQAKLEGRKVQLRKDWEHVKEAVMMTALRAKFTQHPRLRQLLLETGVVPLHEDSPSDMYWGCRGKDRLGQLMTMVRTEIRESLVTFGRFSECPWCGHLKNVDEYNWHHDGDHSHENCESCGKPIVIHVQYQPMFRTVRGE